MVWFCRSFLFVAVVAAVASTPAFADQLITNGGFEAGSFSGFNVSGGYNFVEHSPSGGYTSHSGSYFALLGTIGAPGMLSQSFNDVAGQGYTFSYYLASNGTTPNSFAAMFDGNTLIRTINVGVQPYTLYSFQVTGTGHDTVLFDVRDDPNYLALDDVSFSSSTSVTPEPSSLLLLGTGLLGVVGSMRRRLSR